MVAESLHRGPCGSQHSNGPDPARCLTTVEWRHSLSPLALVSPTAWERVEEAKGREAEGREWSRHEQPDIGPARVIASTASASGCGGLPAGLAGAVVARVSSGVVLQAVRKLREVVVSAEGGIGVAIRHGC